MLDPDRLDGVRFSVDEARVLGETSLQHCKVVETLNAPKAHADAG